MFSFLSRIYRISNPPTPSEDAPSPTKTVKFGCLGAAKITPDSLINPARSHSEVVLYGIAARDVARAEAYAKKHGFRKAFGGASSYQDLIDDPEVDAIYNALPNGLHYEWTMKALAGGKHVLLEKPATNTAEEASQIFALADRKGLVVLEAFHNRFHPANQRMKAIVDSKELGAIKSISSALTAPAGFIPADDMRWDLELGGGSTMDPGAYTVAYSRYLASSDPTSVLTATAERYSSSPQHEKVDKMFTATMAFPNDIFAELHSNLWEPKMFGIIPRMPKMSTTVHCEEGSVEIFNILLPHFYHSITVKPKGKPQRVEKAYTFEGTAKGEDWWSTYRYQLEAFVDKIQGRKPQTWIEPQDTIGNMKWIEEIYAKDGFGSRPTSKYVPAEL